MVVCVLRPRSRRGAPPAPAAPRRRHLDAVERPPVIDAALSNGANEINSLDFSASDTKAVRKVALLNAIQDARDKADIITKGLGKRIVGIQNVSESTGYIETRRFGGNMLMAAAKDAATPIAPGSLSLTANVHVDFILSD